MTTTAKGGKLSGGALTAEAIGSSRKVLTGASRSGKGVGLQQFFTPPALARFVADVLDPGRRHRVLDPTAGAGDLLEPYDPSERYGVEIDSDHTQDAPYTALPGDIQKAYGIMRLAGLQFSRIAANPPFGLTWSHPSIEHGRSMNSCLSCFHIMLGLLDNGGVAAMICGTSRLHRELLADDTFKRAAWAVVDIEGRVFEGADLPTSVVFFCDPDRRSIRPMIHESIPLNKLDARSARMNAQMGQGVESVSYPRFGADIFPDVVKTYAQRHPVSGKPRYDITIESGQVRVHLGALGKLLHRYRPEAILLDQIDHQPPNYFALNSRDWETVRALLDDGVITASPGALSAVEAAICEAKILLRPMYPVPTQMRLGFLRDLTEIECVKDDPGHDFEVGETYSLSVDSKVTHTKTQKLVEKRDGTHEPRTMEVVRRVLKVTINGQTFDESPNDITYLAEHFNLPDPGDLQTDHPEELQRVKNVLLEIQAEWGPADPPELTRCSECLGHPDQGDWHLSANKGHARTCSRRGKPANATERLNAEGWKIKPFQLEDLARGILKRRAVLAHDPGLGKTMQQLLAAEACWRLGYSPRWLALFIAPQDLHEQWQREALRFVGQHLELIRTPGDAARARRRVRDGGEGWFITHYEALSMIGAKDDDRRPVVPVYRAGESRISRRVQINTAMHERTPEWKAREQRRFDTAMREWTEAGAALPPRYADDGWRVWAAHHAARPVLKEPTELPSTTLTTKDACPRCLEPAGEHWDGLNCTAVRVWTEKIKDGEYVERRKGCGYTHRLSRVPTVASILSNVFKAGVICVDELSMVRGDYSRRSLAVRGLRAGCRFGASATPISNYINDCYWGVGWTIGWGTPRFPYSYEDGKAKFEADFCVIEYMMGREDDGEESLRKRRKVLPEVTNLSMLWRLFSMSIIRRRKEDTGEAIVPNRPYVIEVPPGRAQKEMHMAWLQHFPAFFIERNPEHPLVLAGLVERFAAGIGMLAKMDYASTLPEQDPDLDWLMFNTDVDGVSNFTPAIAKALELIERHVRAGDKVLVGSSLMETGPFLARLLKARGINAVHITENRNGKNTTKNPRARARDVTKFINGDATVLCAGVQAMKLGHNLDCASAVVLLGLPWSHEAKKQFLDRVHRLTSKRPVTTYLIVPAGTIAERKLELLDNKEGASDVALDGRLVDQNRERHDWNKTLAEMREAGLQIDGDEIEESAVLAEWERRLHDVEAFASDLTPQDESSVDAALESVFASMPNADDTPTAKVPRWAQTDVGWKTPTAKKITNIFG